MVSASICSSSRAPVRPLPPILRAACGGEPDALRLTWYGTALGIANEAEAHNDSLLPLDEVGQGSSAKDVATSAYTPCLTAPESCREPKRAAIGSLNAGALWRSVPGGKWILKPSWLLVG